MKLLAIGLITAVASVAAQPHRHAHRHDRRTVAKREPATAAVYVPGPVETVIVYELNGHPISEDEVRQGIANGTLTWGSDGVLSSSSAVIAPTSTPAALKDAGLSDAAPQNDQPDQPVQQTQPVEQSSPSAAPSDPAPEAPARASPPADPGTYQPINDNGDCPDCDKEFRNDYYSCDQFPTSYGAISLHNEGLGGWTGIQDPVYRGADGFDDIMTVPKDSCQDGPCCTPGRFCSYGCPNPYLKMSFPKKQGRTLQSVGGLYCNENSRLEMADGSIGKTLCGKGSKHMKVTVENRLQKPVSICRTDYPGMSQGSVHECHTYLAKEPSLRRFH
jgi:hypothetical protein